MDVAFTICRCHTRLIDSSRVWTVKGGSGMRSTRRRILMRGSMMTMGAAAMMVAGTSMVAADPAVSGDGRDGETDTTNQQKANKARQDNEADDKARSKKKLKDDLSGDPTKNSHYNPAEDSATSLRNRVSESGRIPGEGIQP